MEKYFIYTYACGIIIAMLASITGGQGVIFGKIYMEDYSIYILPFSLTHMLLLILLGYRLPLSRRNLAGDRVQTAGYLHTLIGFSAALLHVSTHDFNLSEIMSPLGSALITSIMGWFAGGELSSTAHNSDVPGIKDEMGKIAIELKDFLTSVQEAHTCYVDTIKGASDEYEKLQEKQKEVISKSTEALAEIDETLKTLNDSYGEILESVRKSSKSISESFGARFHETTQQVLENARKHAAALEGAASEAKNTQKYLSESRVLIEELERLLKYVTSAKST